MDVSALLIDLYDRIPPLARAAVDGLDLDRLTEVPEPGANSIAWLVWHLTRVQDHHVAELLGADQLWVDGGGGSASADGGWARRFGLDPDPWNTGYGHTASEVATVRPESPAALLAYHDAVADRTRAMLRDLTPADLDRVVDRNWSPPVTLGVRLVSVADDSLQHVGQAAYVRGLLARRKATPGPR